MKKIATIVTIFVIVALIALNFAKNGIRSSASEIFVSGNIEVTEVEVGFEISGRVERRPVDEGEWIEKGDLVAILDQQALIEKLAQQKAEYHRAKAHLLEYENGYLPEEIGQARAQVDQTNAEWTQQELDYVRQQSLFERQVISAREFDQSTANYFTAKARYEESLEHLKRLERGTRFEQIEQARAGVSEALEGLALARTNLGYGSLLSPISGYVLSKNIEAGEYVIPGTPVVTVGDLYDIWLRAYVNEIDLGKVKLGQKVRVKTDSYPRKEYHGEIIFIASEAEFTPKNVQTDQERVKLVYRIKVQLDNPDMELKPGMPADGWIAIK